MPKASATVYLLKYNFTWPFSSYGSELAVEVTATISMALYLDDWYVI